MVELDAIAVDETNGYVGTEGRDGELFQEIPPDLKMCISLPLGLICLRWRGFPFKTLTIGTAWSRLVMSLRDLPAGFRRFVCESLSEQRFWSRGCFIENSLAGIRGSRILEPRWRISSGMVSLRILSYFQSVMKSHCERSLCAHHPPSTLACTTHQSKRYPMASLPESGGVVPK